jgi:MscS family membrane protein
MPLISLSLMRKKNLFFSPALVCFLMAALRPAGAQLLPSTTANPAKAAADALNRETPSGTVLGFLEAAQSGNYSIAAQYLQLSPARRQSEGDTLAQQLKLVMDRALAGSLKNVSTEPEGRPEEGVPPGRQRLGTMSAGDVEVDLTLVRISDPSVGKIWLISSETLAKVPELYDQVEAHQVESKLPKWLVKHQLAGMALWQWIALLLLIPIAAAAGWLLILAFQIPLRWWAARHGHAEIAHIRSVSGPAWLLAGTLIHRILAAYLGMPLLQRHYYTQITAVAVIVGASWIFWRIVRWFLQRVRSQALAHGRSGTGSLMLLGERMVKAFIFVMTLFFIFGVLGFNLTTALAGVGIGTLAVGFGAQQTIANLFGGVSVLGDEVIRVGDVCKFGDRTGVVEDIGLRSTRVRTEERTLLAIPNGTVATINVENLSRRDKILLKTILALHTDTPQEGLRSILAQIRTVLKGEAKIEAASARVRLVELTSSAINIELACYVMTTDFDEFATVREDVLMRIMNLVEDSGASLASSQKLYIVPDHSSNPTAAQSTMQERQSSSPASSVKSPSNGGKNS